jgi:hypothetical protein
MTFRLTTLMYLFALVAASLTAFGAWGPYAIVGVMVTWGLLLLIPHGTNGDIRDLAADRSWSHCSLA